MISDYEFSFNLSYFEEGTYIFSVRAEDDKGFGYTNITIVIRFEKPFDFMPFVTIGVIVSLAIIGVVIANIKISAWIIARRDREVQESMVEK